MIELKKISSLKWRQFLATDAGMEGMLYMRERTPSVIGGDSTQIIFEAGKSEGYKFALDRISEVIAIDINKDQDKNLENQ